MSVERGNDGDVPSEDVEAELDAALAGPITVDITTTGRRSGELRRIEIWIVNIDGRVVIAGTPGERDWLANLRSNPELTVHFKETTTADVGATAIEVGDAAVRTVIWNHPATQWYRGQTPIADLIASGPVVELTWR